MNVFSKGLCIVEMLLNAAGCCWLRSYSSRYSLRLNWTLTSHSFVTPIHHSNQDHPSNPTNLFGATWILLYLGASASLPIHEQLPHLPEQATHILRPDYTSSKYRVSQSLSEPCLLTLPTRLQSEIVK